MNLSPDQPWDVDRFRAVEDLFVSVLDADPETRRGLLEAADPDIRAEVGRLLGASARAEELLEDPHWDIGPTPSLPRGTQVGRYTVERELGRGGMGVVYLARQDEPRREVALKVCSALSESAALRFRQEAEVLARLQHPGIAAIHESGIVETVSGPAPYLVMERVQGRPITRYVGEQRCGVAEVLRLVMALCGAVEHAHQRAVLHRDIKPGNVLVEDQGRVRLLDFGVAALIDEAASGRGEPGLVGTLPYMSPEQAAGRSGDADVRSDVYSVGVLLYRLLTGRLPISPEGRSPPEMLRAIQEEAFLPLGVVVPSLRGDLDWILARTLAKDPDRRYASAGSLRDDLARFLIHRPVAARPQTTGYVVGKFVRRHRAVSVAVAGCILAVAAGGVSTAWQLHRAGRAEALAVARLEEARKLARSLLLEVPGLVRPLPGSVAVPRELMRRALDSMDILLGGANDPASLAELGDAYISLGSTTGAPDAPSTEDFPEGRRLVDAGVELLERASVGDGSMELAMALARAYSVRSGFAETREQRLGLTDRAIEWERAALARCTETPGGPRWATLSEHLAYDLGRAGADAAMLGQGDERLRDAVSLMERVVSLRPGERRHSLTLAMLLSASSSVLEERDPPRSQQLAERAVVMLRDQRLADPANYSVVRHLAAASSMLARHLARGGHAEEAIACIDRVAAEAAPVMAADPSNSLMVSDLVEVQLWRAEVRCLAAESGSVGVEVLDAAETILQEAIRGASAAGGNSGVSPTSQDRLARLRVALDRVRAARGRSP